MAPDVNSLPTSPRSNRLSFPTSQPVSNTPSRRTSQIMGPPTAPASASAPVQSPHAHARVSPVVSTPEQAGVPLRHPRPLTPAELYLECEKEQEAVVNRLTRELTALRAQSASVASNASHSSNSTSASLLPVDIADPNPAHQMTGPTHPTPSRRHRSSSSLSSRGLPTPLSSVSAGGSHSANVSNQAQTGSTASTQAGGVSQASAARFAAAGGNSLSRQPSMSASGASTPARQSLDLARQPITHHVPPIRPSMSRDPSQNTLSSTHAQPGTPFPQQAPAPAQSPGVSTAMQHFVDTAAYRSEMEIVKAENEALRQRVRALERALRTRRRDSSQSDAPRPDLRASRESTESGRGPGLASPSSVPSGVGVAAWAAGSGGVGGVAGPRERSESQSTTASSRRGVGVSEDDVRVGESASSIGVGRGV